jgi:homoisocitrate dehydrogenase
MRKFVRLALIAGDGIGKEVVPLVPKFLERFSNDFDFQYTHFDAGWEYFKQKNVSISKHTFDVLQECDAAVFGAVSSPTEYVVGYKSPIIELRRHFDLFANVRPNKFEFVKNGKLHKADITIIRENTECLYISQEMPFDDDVIALRKISRKASEQIAKFACKYHKTKNSAIPLMICHKANILPFSDGLFKKTCIDVCKKLGVCYNDQLVDSLAMDIVLKPSKFDVIVCPNLYGDILSDVVSGLAGGLGMSPSLNIGNKFVIAEPVHGSAPDIAGLGIANPIATIKSVGMLLDYLENTSKYTCLISDSIDFALKHALEDMTPDVGGTGTTISAFETICRYIATHQNANSHL